MDMTDGPLIGKIIKYSLPIIASGMLQLLYNAADMIVVGKFAETGSLAAVGATGALINLLVNVFMGLSVGTCVVVARHYGAHEYEAANRAAHTSVTVSVLCGIFVGIAGFFLARPLLILMKTPPDVIERSVVYMKIFFVGIPANMLYNFGAAILRATGDTRRPLYYLGFAGIVNVILNLVFVICFKMGVAGVSTATIISQLISAVLVIRCLFLSDGVCKIEYAKLKIDRAELIKIAKIGIPAGIQGSVFSISNVMIQSSINSFGSIAMEGNTAAANLEGFIYNAMNSISQSALSFTGQNYGAGKIRRIRLVLIYCCIIVTVIGLFMGITFYLLRVPLLSLYVNDPQMIEYGGLRMAYICAPYFFCGLMDVVSGAMRGLGRSTTPMVVSLLGACLSRIIWIYTVFAAYPTLSVLYLSYPLSWILTLAVHLICYFTAYRHVRDRAEAEADAGAVV